MPYAVSNNGLTQQWHDPSENYQLKTGEVMLPNNDAATITAAFPGYPAAQAAALATPLPLDAAGLTALLVSKGVITQTAVTGAQTPPVIPAIPTH